MKRGASLTFCLSRPLRSATTIAAELANVSQERCCLWRWHDRCGSEAWPFIAQYLSRRVRPDRTIAICQHVPNAGRRLGSRWGDPVRRIPDSRTPDGAFPRSLAIDPARNTGLRKFRFASVIQFTPASDVVCNSGAVAVPDLEETAFATAF